MGEMPKVGQVWVRHRLFRKSEVRIVRMVDVGETHAVIVIEEPRTTILHGRYVPLDDWHRWSRKATLVKEADNGDC